MKKYIIFVIIAISLATAVTEASAQCMCDCVYTGTFNRIAMGCASCAECPSTHGSYTYVSCNLSCSDPAETDTNITNSRGKFLDSMKITGALTGYTDMEETDSEDPAQIFGKVVNGILSFIGVIFLVLMIYGGYKWMMSAGNEQEVAKAKNTIKAAIIGIVIVLAAYAITSFIGTAISSTSNP